MQGDHEPQLESAHDLLDDSDGLFVYTVREVCTLRVAAVDIGEGNTCSVCRTIKSLGNVKYLLS
jgi:hypothetical protein